MCLTISFILVPENLYDEEERIATFTYKTKKFIVSNYEKTYKEAQGFCLSEYRGALAIISDTDAAQFFANALSETNVETDSLWVGGQYNSIANVWEWRLGGGKRQQISVDLNQTMKVNAEIQVDRKCLSFARLQHDKPELRPLSCIASRGFICEPGSKQEQILLV